MLLMLNNAFENSCHGFFCYVPQARNTKHVTSIIRGIPKITRINSNYNPVFYSVWMTRQSARNTCKIGNGR